MIPEILLNPQLTHYFSLKDWIGVDGKYINVLRNSIEKVDIESDGGTHNATIYFQDDQVGLVSTSIYRLKNSPLITFDMSSGTSFMNLHDVKIVSIKYTGLDYKSRPDIAGYIVKVDIEGITRTVD